MINKSIIKKNPYQKVGIKDVVPNIKTINNSTQKSETRSNINTNVAAAYQAAQTYFMKLRDIINSYDPDLGIEYYNINVSDIAEHPGDPNSFHISITMKETNEEVTSFDCRKGNSSWDESISRLATTIINLIRRFRETNDNNNQIKFGDKILTSKNNLSSFNINDIPTPDLSNLLGKSNNFNDNNHKIIETETKDNITYYPVTLVENSDFKLDDLDNIIMDRNKSLLYFKSLNKNDIIQKIVNNSNILDFEYKYIDTCIDWFIGNDNPMNIAECCGFILELMRDVLNKGVIIINLKSLEYKIFIKYICYDFILNNIISYTEFNKNFVDMIK